MNADRAIVAKDLTRKFGDFVACDRITFDVGKGEVFGFLGANGAGKTTAIRMLTGLLAPSSGQATVAGFDVSSQSEVDQAAHRLHEPAVLAVRRPHRLREHPPVRRHLRPDGSSDSRSNRRDALASGISPRRARPRPLDSTGLAAETGVLRRPASRTDALCSSTSRRAVWTPSRAVNSGK